MKPHPRYLLVGYSHYRGPDCLLDEWLDLCDTQPSWWSTFAVTRGYSLWHSP